MHAARANMDKNFSPEKRRDDWCVPRNHREHCRDCLTYMQLLRNRPDVLARALLDLGVNESGDEIIDADE